MAFTLEIKLNQLLYSLQDVFACECLCWNFYSWLQTLQPQKCSRLAANDKLFLQEFSLQPMSTTRIQFALKIMTTDVQNLTTRIIRSHNVMSHGCNLYIEEHFRITWQLLNFHNDLFLLVWQHKHSHSWYISMFAV